MKSGSSAPAVPEQPEPTRIPVKDDSLLREEERKKQIAATAGSTRNATKLGSPKGDTLGAPTRDSTGVTKIG